MDIIETAATMIGCRKDNIPKSLEDKLERINILLGFVDGQLNSRQAVAIATEQWLSEHGYNVDFFRTAE